MKILQTTVLSLLAASAATAGERVKITVVEPTPVPAVTPVAAPTIAGWYVEAAAFVGRSNQDIASSPYADAPMPERVDIIGGDVTVGYNLDAQNALQLRLGYGFGKDMNSEGEAYWNMYKNSIKVHTFTFMPGYRFTYQMNDSWSLFGAVHAGLANQSLKFETEGIEANNRFHHERDHSSDWGFAYSAEVGVRYNISSSMYTFLAYEFRGSDVESSIRSSWHNDDVQSKAQTYHVIRLGMGCSF